MIDAGHRVLLHSIVYAVLDYPMIYNLRYF